jgi:ubiquinone/menaquinone biosynthesis C-methylase UbiE
VKQLDLIKDYYGKVLSSKNDLKTTACCSAEVLPNELKELVAKVHEDVRAKFYGCGVPIPPALNGMTVLDLGSGSGRDGFMLAGLVGDNGQVIGVEMTDEQIATARQYIDYHKNSFGLTNHNVDFRQGYIEDLAGVDIADNSVDVIVSNCVINLSPDKERVFSEAFRVLRPGGELYFSDVFADRRLPVEFQTDKVLLGECLGGALYLEDFRRILARQGCYDFRVVAQSEIEVTDPEIKKKVGHTKFYSITVRAFKLPLEDRCEDYGQVAWYKGSIESQANGFLLDDHHYFERGKPVLVCANTAAMLSQTRYQDHFRVEGDTTTHYGLFDCISGNVERSESGDPSGCC